MLEFTISVYEGDTEKGNLSGAEQEFTGQTDTPQCAVMPRRELTTAGDAGTDAGEERGGGRESPAESHRGNLCVHHGVCSFNCDGNGGSDGEAVALC